ncbi:WD40 repeat-like protein, partial [Aureobasidium melanogenum]
MFSAPKGGIRARRSHSSIAKAPKPERVGKCRVRYSIWLGNIHFVQGYVADWHISLVVARKGRDIARSVGSEADPEEASRAGFNGSGPLGDLVAVPSADDALIVENLSLLAVDGVRRSLDLKARSSSWRLSLLEYQLGSLRRVDCTCLFRTPLTILFGLGIDGVGIDGTLFVIDLIVSVKIIDPSGLCKRHLIFLTRSQISMVPSPARATNISPSFTHCTCDTAAYLSIIQSSTLTLKLLIVLFSKGSQIHTLFFSCTMAISPLADHATHLTQCLSSSYESFVARVVVSHATKYDMLRVRRPRSAPTLSSCGSNDVFAVACRYVKDSESAVPSCCSNVLTIRTECQPLEPATSFPSWLVAKLLISPVFWLPMKPSPTFSSSSSQKRRAGLPSSVGAAHDAGTPSTSKQHGMLLSGETVSEQGAQSCQRCCNNAEKVGDASMPGMYASRINEAILAREPRPSRHPADIFVDRGMAALQITVTGRREKSQSVKAFMPPAV